MRAVTGEQFVLSKSTGPRQSRAIITELAAGLRELVIDGVAITETYPESSLPPSACGIVLAPWPNRVRDGAWVLDGKQQQLDITEPAQGNAIHGLLRNAPYRVDQRAESSITLAATIFPQHGYPFLVETTVRYELLDDGLRVTHTATNRSDAAAPVAFGAHPFLRIGDVPVGDLTLTSEATTRITTDARQNPTGTVPVAGDDDLRTGRAVRELQLDSTFSGLPVHDGVITAQLTAPDGRAVKLWQQADWPWQQIFTKDEFPRSDGPGRAIAIEPMTAPPNALNSGDGLRWLATDECWSTSWGISYVA